MRKTTGYDRTQFSADVLQHAISEFVGLANAAGDGISCVLNVAEVTFDGGQWQESWSYDSVHEFLHNCPSGTSYTLDMSGVLEGGGSDLARRLSLRSVFPDTTVSITFPSRDDIEAVSRIFERNAAASAVVAQAPPIGVSDEHGPSGQRQDIIDGSEKRSLAQLPSTAMAIEPAKRRGRPPSGGREAILDATLALLRERGVASVTSREVAARAGVSEASVYYHYTDKAGLLRAVFESGLQPLQALTERRIAGEDRHQTLATLSRAIEQFLDQSLPVIMAAQSDAQLREDLAAYMAEHDLGPHRGVQTLGAYLTAEQAAGRIAADTDPDTIAFLLVAASFLRAAQRQIMGHAHAEPLPTLEQTLATLDALLRRPIPPPPPTPPPPGGRGATRP